MKIKALIESIQSGAKDESLEKLYGKERLESQKKRYVRILSKALESYGDVDAKIYSAPGRTEVGGNHTDHQLGRVLAASIDLDVVAIVVPTAEKVIAYSADAFSVKPVDLTQLDIKEEEKNTTESLIRGIAARFVQLGYTIGGFKCYAESDVLPGSGMSSSAAFEILIAEILSSLYNEEKVDPITQAMIGQYAENVYFGKASGLMDQMACSVGGFVTIDFYDAKNPKVKQVPFALGEAGYELILTDCKQSHADLSDEYSKVPSEMKDAAKVMGQEVLSRCTMEDLLKHAKEVREACGDRAFLRAYHFLNETDRVTREVNALMNHELSTFFDEIKASGLSSFMYLQNVYPPNDSKHESLAVGLALSENFLKEEGAWRVHGGGFAGTIQAFVPIAKASDYIHLMESVFGKGCCYALQIRSVGGVEVCE